MTDKDFKQQNNYSIIFKDEADIAVKDYICDKVRENDYRNMAIPFSYIPKRDYDNMKAVL